MNQGNANVSRKLPGMTKPKVYFILIFCGAWDLFFVSILQTQENIDYAFRKYLFSQNICVSTV